MEVAVFGAGYVGLVQAAGLASTGNKVYLLDISKDRIEMLRKGKIPIYEPGLEDLIRSGNQKGYLEFIHTDDQSFAQVLERSEIYFLAVQTPEDKDGMPKLDYLFSALEMVASTPGTLDKKFVVTKSTVPVGTGDKVESFLKERGKNPVVVSNPEFLKQGSAVQDFLKPERVIIGAENPVAFEVLGFLHRPFMMKRERIVFMSRRSAEFVKYACNSFLAAKISFINEMSRLTEKLGANIQEVREGMITDSRIGDQFLFPGIGYGGSCLPKDTHALIAQGEKIGMSLDLLKAVDKVNVKQRLWPYDKLREAYPSGISGMKVAIWGLSFKPNTDDLREAPSIPLVKKLIADGAEVQAHDPAAVERFKAVFENEPGREKLSFASSPYEAANNSSALLVLTEWQEYRTPSFQTLKERMKTPIVIDGRDIYEKQILESAGFRYFGVGVPA